MVRERLFITVRAAVLVADLHVKKWGLFKMNMHYVQFTQIQNTHTEKYQQETVKIQNITQLG